MKLMIIDGNSIVNRAFYGIRMLTALDGTPTNAVYGFIAILQRLLDDQKPDALCVSFDLKAPTFRHEGFEGYKAQRKAMPEELAARLDVTRQSVSKWESGQSVPDAERLVKLSELFGVSVDFLLKGDGPPAGDAPPGPGFPGRGRRR